MIILRKGGQAREKRNHVPNASIKHRFLVPLFLALTVMIVSRVAYLNAWRIDNRALYHAVAVIAGTIQFASILLGGLAVYPLSYFRGATGPERVMACSANPAAWVLIDTYDVSAAFPWGASLYYGLNIGAILFAWSFAWMGLLELACRWGRKRKEGRGRIVTPLPFLPILLFLLVAYYLSKEGGAAYFNMLLDGYLVLFRN